MLHLSPSLASKLYYGFFTALFVLWASFALMKYQAFKAFSDWNHFIIQEQGLLTKELASYDQAPDVPAGVLDGILKRQEKQRLELLPYWRAQDFTGVEASLRLAYLQSLEAFYQEYATAVRTETTPSPELLKEENLRLFEAYNETVLRFIPMGAST